MKLARLEATTQTHSADAVARAHAAVDAPVRRVEAMEAVAIDRERSLQQELAEVDPRALGPFAGGERVLADARQVAASLSHLADAGALLKTATQAVWPPHVDDEA
ncbi:MAG: hypothetical protein PHT48_07825 [Dechloromonas sp.]|nr:hypothetical protein [Dechloromonas sp.]